MKFDLEDRLINFACNSQAFAESLPGTPTGVYMADQLLRSGTAPALLYGEAQAAESRKDFIHKMKIALKELRETSINLRIVHQRKMENNGTLEAHLRENNELIAIFVKSIKTASSSP